MYVCNCNGITVSDVGQAHACGVREVADVFEHHGVEQCCGKCTSDVRDHLAEAETSSETSPKTPSAAEVATS